MESYAICSIIGITTVTRVPGYSGYAIRIETVIAAPDTSESYIINTNNPCSDPDQWTGGVPYSQQPTAITGYFRYNLPANDSALMIVIFRQGGVHIGDNVIMIKGTGSQTSFAQMSFPVTCTGIPDSVIIAFASSNKLTNQGIQNGSFIEIDDLAFTGTTQPIPGGDFENWTPSWHYDLPGWSSTGNSVVSTTDSYSGTYAARLTTTFDACGYSNVSAITTGTYTNYGTFGGQPYTNVADTLCGYYKYLPAGSDSAFIFVTLTNNGNNVGGNFQPLQPASSYTYFELPILAMSTPDTIRIEAGSSMWPADPSNSGSSLQLDNLWLKSSPLGINEQAASPIGVYPNPAGSALNISLRNCSTYVAVITIMDISGREVMMMPGEIINGDTALDISDLSAGSYFIVVDYSGVTSRTTFVKQ